jgi:hypothetical protein
VPRIKTLRRALMLMLMLTQERPIFDNAISRGEFAADAD